MSSMSKILFSLCVFLYIENLGTVGDLDTTIVDHHLCVPEIWPKDCSCLRVTFRMEQVRRIPCWGVIRIQIKDFAERRVDDSRSFYLEPGVYGKHYITYLFV